MTSRLFLMRHAKSDWSARQPDRERPLNARGRRAAALMGRWLRSQSTVPDAIYSSTAIRAEQTVRGLLEHLDYDPAGVRREARLYLASLSTLLELSQSWLKEASSIMLVGHNPGLEELLDFLVPGAQLQPYGKHFPTAALAELELDSERGLDRGGARLVRLVRPRDLEHQST